MAPHNPPKREPQSVDYTIALDRLVRIFAARGTKPARTVGEKHILQDSGIKREVALVETDRFKNKNFHEYILA
jgi:hypothetical protein